MTLTGWRRTLFRSAIVVLVALSVWTLLRWLADVPTQYPDHGLGAIIATESSDVVATVECLIEQVRLDPERFGVGDDFAVTRRDETSTVLIVHGPIRRTSVTWVENGIRVRSNPLSSGEFLPTPCQPWESVSLESE